MRLDGGRVHGRHATAAVVINVGPQCTVIGLRALVVKLSGSLGNRFAPVTVDRKIQSFFS